MTDTDSTTAAAEPPEPKPTREMERRWGKEVMEPGFTFIPSVLLRAQARLRIDAIDLAVLVHLIDHWWQSAEMPFPSKRRLAERLMVSEKTIQRAVARLEAEGLVRRIARHYPGGGQASNFYDLAPLVERLQPIAKDVMAARAEARATLRRPERPVARTKRSSAAAKTGGGE